MDCTDPRISFRRLLQPRPDGGIYRFFQGHRTGYAALTRTAIFRACVLLGIGSGDEVLAPAFNCGSEIDPILAAGATVALFDVKADTSIDLDNLRAGIGPRTKAIYVTHYFGFPQSRIAEIRALCRQRGLFLIEDCALTFPAPLGDGTPGSFGDVALFCFYKFVPVIGGGALVINNPDIAGDLTFTRPQPWRAMLRPFVVYAINTLAGRRGVEWFHAALDWFRWRPAKNAGSSESGSVRPDMAGHLYFDDNYRDAAMSSVTRRLLASFDLSRSTSIRRANFDAYLKHLTNVPGIEPVFTHLPKGVCPTLFPVRVADHEGLHAALQARYIGSTPLWGGYHRELDFEPFPEACALKDRLLGLPVHEKLNVAHVAYVSDTLVQLVADSQR